MADQRKASSSLTAFPRTTQALRVAPFPPTVEQARQRMARVALKWRDLAERRRAHFADLYDSGRWKHYYTDIEFVEELRQAVAIAQRWAKIAPRPEELPAKPIEAVQPKAA